MKKRPAGVESGERLNSKSYNQYSEGLQIGGAGDPSKAIKRLAIFLFSVLVNVNRPNWRGHGGSA